MEDLERVAIKLGFDFADHKVCSANQIYRILGIETDDYQVLTFDKVVKKT